MCRIQFWSNKLQHSYLWHCMTDDVIFKQSKAILVFEDIIFFIISSQKAIYIMLIIHAYYQSRLYTNVNSWLQLQKKIIEDTTQGVVLWFWNLTSNNTGLIRFVCMWIHYPGNFWLKHKKNSFQIKKFFPNTISSSFLFWIWNKWSPSPISCSLKTSPGPNHKKWFPSVDPWERERWSITQYGLWDFTRWVCCDVILEEIDLTTEQWAMSWINLQALTLYPNPYCDWVLRISMDLDLKSVNSEFRTNRKAVLPWTFLMSVSTCLSTVLRIWH